MLVSIFQQSNGENMSFKNLLNLVLFISVFFLGISSFASSRGYKCTSIAGDIELDLYNNKFKILSERERETIEIEGVTYFVQRNFSDQFIDVFVEGETRELAIPVSEGQPAIFSFLDVNRFYQAKSFAIEDDYTQNSKVSKNVSMHEISFKKRDGSEIKPIYTGIDENGWISSPYVCVQTDGGQIPSINIYQER